MLISLSISNYVLIDNLEIRFPEGLVIITGETGAGKSILIGALNLLLGARADYSVIKNPEKNCVIEAVFKTDTVITAGMENGKQLILRRVICPDGKSRSFINDEPTGLQILKEISGKLIDIHEQHQQLLFGDNRFPLSVLDSFAGTTDLLAKYRVIYDELKDLEYKKKILAERIAKQEEEAGYNRFRYDQLKATELVSGEMEELENEYRILNNAEKIKSSLIKIASLFNYEDISFVQNIKEAIALSSRISSDFPAIIPVSERLESCRIEIIDLEYEIRNLSDSISVSPQRTELVGNRLSVIYDLLKKHHVSTVEELIQTEKELEIKLASVTDNYEEMTVIERKIEAAKSGMQENGDRLSAAREAFVKLFSEAMTSRIRELEMPHAVFEVSFEKTAIYTATGCNLVQFAFSANSNIAPKELSKVAAGGELSRIMLCLKAVMAKGIGMPTLIFDEIDSGVSGSIADKMGKLIDELSQNMQIFAITHLPQIASKGGCHLLVYKEVDKHGNTESKICEICGEERTMEIARMLSGAELSMEAVENAKVFLKKQKTTNF